MESVFVSSHDGKHIKAGNGRQEGIRNSYELWKNSDGSIYVKMKVMKEGVHAQTLFDQSDLDKVLKSGIWYVMKSGYVATSVNFKYLHHLVMNFQGSGKGFQQASVDHINRNPLDNRKQNLRLATCEEQKQNSKGQLEGTKRSRGKSARDLPDGLTQEDLPKYVIYYQEMYGTGDDKKMRNFFRIEKHPAQLTENSEYKNKWATSKKMIDYSIHQKLAEAKTKIREMDQSLLGQSECLVSQF